MNLSGSYGSLPSRFFVKQHARFALATPSSSHNIPGAMLDRSSVTSNMFDQQATSWFSAGSRLDQRIAPRATTFKYSPHRRVEFLSLDVQCSCQGYSALCDKPASNVSLEI